MKYYLLGRGLLPSCGAVTVGVDTGVRLVDLIPDVVLPDRACFFGDPLRSDTVGPTDCERTKFELNSVKILFCFGWEILNDEKEKLTLDPFLGTTSRTHCFGSFLWATLWYCWHQFFTCW